LVLVQAAVELVKQGLDGQPVIDLHLVLQRGRMGVGGKVVCRTSKAVPKKPLLSFICY
jgi:hypothetical protein